MRHVWESDEHKINIYLTEAFLILAQLDQASLIKFKIMIKNNQEAALVLTSVKRYLQGISMKEPDAIVVLYLNMIDEVITYIEPDADINVLCDEVRLRTKS